MYSKILICLAAAGITTAVVAAGPQLGLGRPATPAEIAARSISVAPDGTGLPVGQGSVRSGRKVYEQQCAACHGMKGEGNPAMDGPQLVGGFGTLQSKEPVQTIGNFWPHATTVWDYINRAMPYQRPGTLTADEVYSVTAYLLHLNGIVKESEVLNQSNVAKIAMPNRDGFVNDPRPDIKP